MDTIKEVGTPTGLQFYEIDDSKFAPYLLKPVSNKLICSCPICTIEEDLLDHSFTVTNRLSPLFDREFTCREVLQKSTRYIKGSEKCDALQVVAMFQCGCPYQMPLQQECPLCPGESNVEESYFDVIPYPGGKWLIICVAVSYLTIISDYMMYIKLHDQADTFLKLLVVRWPSPLHFEVTWNHLL